MTRVGPEGGKCFDFDIDDADRGHFDVANIFRDEEKISQLVLISTMTRQTWTLGPNDSNSDKNYQAEDDHHIVGFWG